LPRIGDNAPSDSTKNKHGVPSARTSSLDKAHQKTQLKSQGGRRERKRRGEKKREEEKNYNRKSLRQIGKVQMTSESAVPESSRRRNGGCLFERRGAISAEEALLTTARTQPQP